MSALLYACHAMLTVTSTPYSIPTYSKPAKLTCTYISTPGYSDVPTMHVLVSIVVSRYFFLTGCYGTLVHMGLYYGMMQTC